MQGHSLHHGTSIVLSFHKSLSRIPSFPSSLFPMHVNVTSFRTLRETSIRVSCVHIISSRKPPKALSLTSLSNGLCRCLAIMAHIPQAPSSSWINRITPSWPTTVLRFLESHRERWSSLGAQGTRGLLEAYERHASQLWTRRTEQQHTAPTPSLLSSTRATIREPPHLFRTLEAPSRCRLSVSQPRTQVQREIENKATARPSISFRRL